MKTLQVLRSAFRCNVEEQDDPILWLAGALRGANAELDLLLMDSAAAYAVEGQNAEGLCLAGRPQRHPPRIDRDLLRLIEGGAQVYVVEEDARERGISPDSFVPGLRTVSRGDLAELYHEFERVWVW